jgi:DNA polymerase-3 subunit beta
MEFAIHRNELVRELQTVTGIVERRATLPILANLLVEADGGELALGASDLEVTIRGRARADVKRPGGITLPAARLHDIARSLPEAEVSFKLLDRNQVVISCGRTRFRISGQPREEFPEFPKVDVAAGIRLPARVLRGMIERVAFAISTEEPRYMLRGALLLLEKGRITLVATDGYRLAYISRAADVSPRGEPLRVIVPRKALLEVAKLAENRDEEGDVLFGLAGNHLFFSVGEHLLTSTIPEGTFPRYEEVMPTSSRGTVTVSTEELLDAVKRVALLAPERFGHAVRVELGPGKLELSSETEVGEAHEELPVDYAGEPIVRGFSPRYLTEFLTVVGSESVRLDLECVTAQERSRGVQPKDRPSQLQPEPAGEADYRYIVMPRQA